MIVTIRNSRFPNFIVTTASKYRAHGNLQESMNNVTTKYENYYQRHLYLLLLLHIIEKIEFSFAHLSLLSLLKTTNAKMANACVL
jgi:hypothetical protein